MAMTDMWVIFYIYKSLIEFGAYWGPGFYRTLSDLESFQKCPEHSVRKKECLQVSEERQDRVCGL